MKKALIFCEQPIPFLKQLFMKGPLDVYESVDEAIEALGKPLPFS